MEANALAVFYLDPQYAFSALWLLLIWAVGFGGIAILLLIFSLADCAEHLLRLAQLRAERVLPAPNQLAGDPSENQTQAPSQRASRQALAALQHSDPTTSVRQPESLCTFRVILANDLLPRIHAYVTEFLRQHGEENETGGMFVGEYSLGPETCTKTMTIRGFIEAGPKAEFSRSSILFDADYQAQRFRLLQLEHPSAANLGCAHVQPGTLDRCSAGDAVTDREAVHNSNSKALVFAIMTRNNTHQAPSSVWYRELKFDFYLMAEETGFEYVAFKPELADLPLLESSRTVEELVAARGVSVPYDLMVMRHLPGLSRTTLCIADSAETMGILLTSRLANAAETLHVWVRSDGSLRLIVRNEQGDKHVLPGEWEQPEVGRHVWLSNLLLLGREKLMSTRPRPQQGIHFVGLLEDKHRLVAEVRAMQERYGNRAVLRRRGDTLYWDCTLHESGRSLPIEIQYPDSYPAEPPSVISVKPLPSSPHQLPGNEICWIDRYSAHAEWNPARDTAVICVNAAERWFACLLIYLTFGKWPSGA